MARGRKRSEVDEVQQEVATYVAAGADEEVQRIITAVHRLSRRLTQWYDRQLADLDLSAGEWTVLQELARQSTGGAVTPSRLAEAANIAPSSMTHRLDRMVERGLVTREADPDNRTRVLVRLAPAGRELFNAAIAEANVVESGVLDSLSASQKKQLVVLLEQLIKGVDEADL